MPSVAGPGELTVSEVFGPTLQGEGPSSGRRAGFVRLGRCNLDCGAGDGASWACDTPYTWDWTRFAPGAELRRVGIATVVAQLAAMDGIELVVVTGGEPLLQQHRLAPLLRACRERGWEVEIETNGTVRPRADVTAVVTRFNVSPKLSGSGVPRDRAVRPDALAELRASGRAVFKFVAADPADLDEIATLVDEHRLDPVWVMPAGTTADAVLDAGRALAGPVLDRGWRMTTRLHILLWGDERGR